MKLDPRVVAVVLRFEPRLPLSNWTDDARRTWMRLVVEQVVYSFPTEGYGWKRAGPGRPPSKDALAQRRPTELIGWDLVDGTTHRVNRAPDSINLGNQEFIEVVGVDHLATEPLPIEPIEPIPDTTDEGHQLILDSLVDLAHAVTLLGAAIDQIGQRVEAIKTTQHQPRAVDGQLSVSGLRGSFRGTVAGP